MQAVSLQANVVATIFAIGPSVLRATSGLSEQLRETTIGPSVLRAPA